MTANTDAPWQKKYKKLLADYDQLNLSAEAKYEKIRRALVMTAVLAEGQTSNLDRELRQLRTALKPGSEHLDDSLLNVQKAMDDFEEENIRHIEVVHGLISDASNKLAQLALPHELQQKILEIRHSAGRDLESWFGYRSQLEHWLRVVGELTTPAVLGANQAEPREAHWQKQYVEDQQAESEAQKQKYDAAFNTDFVQGVSQTLQSLLEKVNFPDRLIPLQQSLYQRLQQDLKWHELIPVMDETAGFILQCLENSQFKIEEFLSSLDERLQAIRCLVTAASEGTMERSRARIELDNLVRQQLTEVESAVSDNTDLNVISLNVNKHLRLILAAMSRYRDEEELRESRLGEQIKALMKRLSEAERELAINKQTLEE